MTRPLLSLANKIRQNSSTDCTSLGTPTRYCCTTKDGHTESDDGEYADFDFELSYDDMETLDGISRGGIGGIVRSGIGH